MRKWMLFVLAAALMALAVVPAFAQDEPGTIADIVIASAGAETPEFSTLLAAVQAADPAVVAALSDPEQQLTVFAPTDAAFAALAEALGAEAFAAVLADQPALTDILLFHVVGGKVMSSDVLMGLEAQAMSGYGALTVPTLQGQSLDITQTEDGIQVNGANLNLEMVDIEASNGVIHVIDAVILPESRTIADIATEMAGAEMNAEFTVLLAAVQAAGLAGTLADAEQELTVFAPTDAAFATALEALGLTAEELLGNTELLTSVLLYHVVPGTVRSSDLVAALTAEEMDAMDMPAWLAAKNDDGTLSLNTLTPSADTLSFGVNAEGRATIDNAVIVIKDVDAANGVIHVIDAVVLPAAE